jgi:hypothetical protein
MAYQEERLAILKMIEEGKITAAEGMELMDALTKSSNEPVVTQNTASTNGLKMLRVRVREGHDKVKVNVNIPLTLVKVGLDIAKGIHVGEHQDMLNKIDMDEILRLIDEGASGKLVEVEDLESDTHVEVYVD